jgi:hypothetical protein
LVEFLIKDLMENDGGAKKRVFDPLTLFQTPNPNVDG